MYPSELSAFHSKLNGFFFLTRTILQAYITFVLFYFTGRGGDERFGIIDSPISRKGKGGSKSILASVFTFIIISFLLHVISIISRNLSFMYELQQLLKYISKSDSEQWSLSFQYSCS